MSSVVQLYHKYIGKKALLTVCSRPETSRMKDGHQQTIKTALGIEIPVIILNARESWGREHVLVRPIRGIGTVWAEVTRIRTVDDWPIEEDRPDENQANDNSATD